MLWAVDYQGREIRADQKGVYWSGLRCPECGEPVHRKGGGERKAHFAHYSYSGSADCELYTPSAGGSYEPVSARSDPVGYSGEKDEAEDRDLISRAVLCLDAIDPSRPILKIRLPVDKGVSEAGGRLSIKSSFGTSSVLAKELSRPRFVRVPWSCPPAECSATNECEAIGAQTDIALKRFRFADNFFRSGLAGGVLLAPAAPLQLGEAYWLITQTPFPSKVPWGIEVKCVDQTRGWYKYQIDLPDEFHFDEITAIAELQSFLGRKVLPAVPVAYIQHPLPHHFNPDGIPVFGEETREIRVVLPRGGHAELLGDAAAFAEQEVIGEQAEFLRITGLSVGSLAIYVDGVCHVQAGIFNCAPFRPTGVQLVTKSQAYEIFTPEAKVAFQTTDVEFTVRVPSKRLLRLIKASGAVLTEYGDGLAYEVGSDATFLDAKNFGQVDRQPPDLVVEIEPLIERKGWAGSKALLGLVAGQCGSSMSSRLASFDGSKMQLASWVLANGLAWLYPYIVEMKGSRS